MSDIWKDPRVKAALKERPASDIAVLDCPKCGETGYYNEGSHFTCRFCKRTWYVMSEDETIPPDDRPYMYVEDLRTLADTVDSGWNGGYP